MSPKKPWRVAVAMSKYIVYHSNNPHCKVAVTDNSADANLISAAPDLLAALVALLQDDGAADDISAVRKQARAAIAKATA